MPTLLRFLSAADVLAALPMAEAIDAMKRAFAELSSGAAVMPVRAHVEAEEHGGVALFMPSYLRSMNRLGVKLVTVYDGNPAAGLPRIQAIVLLCDAAHGSPLAVLDGTALTALRTGAASGAATDLLARPDARTAAIFGAGVQGRTQLEAVCTVRPIQRAWVFDADARAAQAFAEEMGPRLGIAVRPAASPAEAVRGADVVCTATPSKVPVFDDADLPRGVHVNAVGSYQPWAQEIPAATVARARVVVDHRASALAETGDLIVPLRQGLLAEDRIDEVGEIVAGERPGRAPGEEVTLFKSVGVAVQDLAAAARALENAERTGLGTTW